MPAPTLLDTFSDAVVLSIRTRKLWSLIPWYLCLTIGVPIFIVWYWNDQATKLLAEPRIVTVLTAVMVVGGLLSSVCVNVMREVFSLVLAEQKFATYLRELGLFDQYIFWPQYTLLIQLVLMMYCVFLIAVFVILPDAQFVPYLVGITFGALLYVATKTYNLVGMVRVLAWHRQQFRESPPEQHVR